MTKTMIQLPRKIWFLWLQGFDQMPELVSKCYRSWCKHHPDWEVIFLDENNVTQFIDVKSIIEDRPSIIHRVSQSEIIRINLLRKYGGVWVDATCFCQQALDDWLFPYLESGFFAFHRPGIDRMLSSWFLAALPGNDLVEIYSETVNEFWPNNPKVKMWVDRPLVYQFIKKSKLHGYLKKRPTLWYHPIFIKVLKV
ncbi:MAG: capsular polysaccharide synthesis protein, partial [Bacteroidota bacterium]